MSSSISSSSSSSPLLNILFIGVTGHIGSIVTSTCNYIKKYKFQSIKLFALVREETLASNDETKLKQLNELKQNNVTIIKGDIVKQSIDELTQLFDEHNIHTVVSMLSVPLIESGQIKLIDACEHSSCVKKFFPSAFGFDLRADSSKFGDPSTSPVPTFVQKIKIQERLKASKLDYVIFTPFIFYEFILSPFCNVDFATNTITAPNGFDTRISGTCLDDVGANLAKILASPQQTSTSKAFICIAGDTFSWAQLADLLEKYSGKKWTRKVVERSILEKRFKTNAYDYLACYQMAMCDQVGTCLDNPQQNSWTNKHFTQHHNITMEQFLKKKYSK